MRPAVPGLLVLALLLPALGPGPALAEAGRDAELLTNGGLDRWSLLGPPCPEAWACSLPPSLGVPAPWAFPRSGEGAVLLAELAFLTQTVPAEPGVSYALSFWFQHPQAGHCMAVYRLLFRDATGEFLARPTEHVMGEVLAWTPALLVAEAPEGAATVTVWLAGGCLFDPPGVFLVDDVSLRAA